jgi:uncharacterized protein (DUF697 family)
MTQNKEEPMVKPEKEKPSYTTGPETKAEAEPAAGIETAPPAVPKHEIEGIIRKRVYASMVVGLAPIPLLDLAGTSLIQIEMVRALAIRYGVPFQADITKTIISSLVGGALPVAAAPAVASMVKFIPLIGWTTAGVSMSLLNGAITYALGNVFAMHFASGGVLLDFDVNKLGSVFKSKLNEGKTVAADMKEEQRASI